MYIVLESSNDSGDEGSYDGNVIGSFVELVDDELTEEVAQHHAERLVSDWKKPVLTIQKHPYDGNYQYMVSVKEGFVEMYYHFQAV